MREFIRKSYSEIKNKSGGAANQAEESDGYNGRTVESEYRDCSFGKHDKGDSDCDESAVVYVSSVILISGNLAS